MADGRVSNPIRRAAQWVREIVASRDVVRELIGRYVVGLAKAIYSNRLAMVTVDETVPNYAFYDKLRRGLAAGYRLGGLFCKRIEVVFAAWVLGRGVTVALAESGDPDDPDDPRNYTDARLAAFLDANHPLLMRVYRNHLGLGDQYIVVNPDGSLSVPSPDTVRVERDPLDFRRVLSITIKTKVPDGRTVLDEYRPDGRTITIKRGADVERSERYANITAGRIPIVHVAHERGDNETNGHPIHEPLLQLYDQYDNILFKQLDGVGLAGNPIPTIEGVENIDETIQANRPATTETYIDCDGNEVEREQVHFDSSGVLLIGKGGTAKFTAPTPGFTVDTKTALKSLFLLLLEHTGIPEFVWGGEMGSSRASTGDQLEQWARDIEGRQRAAAGWIVELCELWLLVRALVDPQLVIDELTAKWPRLIAKDGALQLQRIQYARDEGLLTARTTLKLLELVDDPQRETEAAEAEADARREKLFPDGYDFGGRLDLEAREEAA